MTRRISQDQLEYMAYRINCALGMPADPYSEDGQGRIVPNAGCHKIDYANGGVALHRLNADGGERDILETGHVRKRELYAMMRAFLHGIAAGRRRRPL